MLRAGFMSRTSFAVNILSYMCFEAWNLTRFGAGKIKFVKILKFNDVESFEMARLGTNPDLKFFHVKKEWKHDCCIKVSDYMPAASENPHRSDPCQHLDGNWFVWLTVRDERLPPPCLGNRKLVKMTSNSSHKEFTEQAQKASRGYCYFIVATVQPQSRLLFVPAHNKILQRLFFI